MVVEREKIVGNNGKCDGGQSLKFGAANGDLSIIS